MGNKTDNWEESPSSRENSAMRLQKYLAQCGVASRRTCESMIKQGRVTVNSITAELGMVITPSRDCVLVDGRRVKLPESYTYVLLHKPENVITTMEDPQGRLTVKDYLKGIKARIYPVGRLDRDVGGILLFMDDGELAHRLAHPRYGIKKVYEALVKGHVSQGTAQKLRRGIILEDGPTAPAGVRIRWSKPDRTLLELTLHEGRKREVKRMCAHIGHPIITLRRIQFAGLSLGTLSPGSWRFLTQEEVRKLRKQVNLPHRK